MDLVLSVKRSTFRADDAMSPEADEAFRKVRPKVLERDDHTCRFCGFRSDRYQEVHHRNDDHHDQDPDNLLTVCPLCHLCHHIGYAGAGNHATLIYFGRDAGLGQADLNQLVRALWIAKHSGSRELSLLAINLISRLMKGGVGSHRLLGSSDPAMLGDFLVNLPEEQYARRHEYLRGVLLMPYEPSFEKPLAHWVKMAAQQGFKPDDWVGFAHQKLEGWARDAYGDTSVASRERYLAGVLQEGS